jgi:serine protease Do
MKLIPNCRGRRAKILFRTHRLALVLLAWVVSHPSFCGWAEENPPAKLDLNEAPIARDVRSGTSYAPVVKRVAPSVVNIYTTKRIRLESHPLMRDPFFRRFFGIPDGEDLPDRGSRSRMEQSLGSGVIVTQDGYILTNNHVVEGADEIKVVLADGKREYDAKVVGTDPQTDIAVLRVEAKNLPAISITNSDQLEVGDVVLAIGNPFNVGQTVSMGIVSATGRGGFGMLRYEDFIQTDASINPGNSGGALVDAEGRLVGVNTVIISQSGGSQGIGFAVPINMARNVMDQILKQGKVTRGYLGVSLQEEIPADLARQFKMPDQNGALITEVVPDAPASQAGLKAGDVIIEFQGKKVEDRRQLQLLVAQTPPKTKASLKVLREGRERTFQVTLGEFPSTELGRPGSRGGSPTGRDALEGVEVADLSTRWRRQFSIPTSVTGALVTNVEPDSPAYEAGLRPGEVIVEINRQPVESAEDAVEKSRQSGEKRILLRVWSGGGSRYLVVDSSRPTR